MESDKTYPIKVAARLSGLSTHVIRAWEKRYNAVTPARTGANRRNYTKEDIERLRLLRKVTLLGHNISYVAKLSDEDLMEILQAEEVDKPQSQEVNGRGIQVGESSSPYYSTCIAAIERFDTEGLEAVLKEAKVELGQNAFIEQLIVPLMHGIGDLWREGRLRVAHEHLASAVIHNFLAQEQMATATPSTAPTLLVATPVGQLHDIGALITAITAVSEGWRVIYFGASLPAEEVAGAAQKTGARAVALSIVYPEDDAYLREELRKLGRYLPAGVVLLVGGRSARAYSDVLEEIKARRIDDIKNFRLALEAIRSQKQGKPSPA